MTNDEALNGTLKYTLKRDSEIVILLIFFSFFELTFNLMWITPTIIKVSLFH